MSLSLLWIVFCFFHHLVTFVLISDIVDFALLGTTYFVVVVVLWILVTFVWDAVIFLRKSLSFSSLTFRSRVVLSFVVVQSLSGFDSLWPHGWQHARLPCPSPSPRVCSCLLSRWCHLLSYPLPPSLESPGLQGGRTSQS